MCHPHARMSTLKWKVTGTSTNWFLNQEVHTSNTYENDAFQCRIIYLKEALDMDASPRCKDISFITIVCIQFRVCLCISIHIDTYIFRVCLYISISTTIYIQLRVRLYFSISRAAYIFKVYLCIIIKKTVYIQGITFVSVYISRLCLETHLCICFITAMYSEHCVYLKFMYYMNIHTWIWRTFVILVSY